MGRHYLDHAATTPMVRVAVEAMTAELGRVGNASSLHASGRAARRVVEESREAIAAAVGARPTEVLFTSGGTESNNLAVKGAYAAARAADPRRTRIVTSTVEHHAVWDSVGWLSEAEGAAVSWLGVDRSGMVAPEDLKAVTADEVAVASVMWANNEVGAVQPVAQVAAWARAAGVVSHSDAVQAVGHLPVDFAASGLDLLTFTAHKLGGPYGVGALLARRAVALAAIQHGGGQERDVRSGTLDVAAIAGFAAAVVAAEASREAEDVRLRALRRRLVAGALASVPDTVVNGVKDEALRLPGLANLGFAGCEADAVLMLLDAAGLDCSTGSACTAGVSQPSHVLLAMGRSEPEARASLRFSLGHSSTDADVDALLAALPDAVTRARAAGLLSA